MPAHPPPRRSVRTACVLGTFAAVAAAAAPWPAQAQGRRLTVIGAGAGMTCAEWVADKRSDPELEQWAFGFASAIAAAAQMQHGGDPLGSMDADAIHAWLGDHCRQHPKDALSVALIRIVLAAQR